MSSSVKDRSQCTQELFTLGVAGGLTYLHVIRLARRRRWRRHLHGGEHLLDPAGVADIDAQHLFNVVTPCLQDL